MRGDVESFLSSTGRPHGNTSGIGSGYNVVSHPGEVDGEVSRKRSVDDDRKAVKLDSDAAGSERFNWLGVRGRDSYFSVQFTRLL